MRLQPGCAHVTRRSQRSNWCVAASSYYALSKSCTVTKNHNCHHGKLIFQ
jgi:hypothetical protein